ncbi:MAG: glycosyltransferase [Pseudomonadota bacterium]
MTLGVALLCLAAWLGLRVRRRDLWRAAADFGEGAVSNTPSVVAIVPARNEAATIRACLRALVAQDYAGSLVVVLVDDGSDDATAALAAEVARDAARPVHVVAAPAKPHGWSGKVAAQQTGRRAVRELGLDAPWLWLTDADIVHEPDVLRRLVAEAQTRDLDLASLMVRLSTASAAERWLAPAFVYFFQLLYPFDAVNDPARSTAAAAGGCVLVRTRALDAAGGFAAIADRLIDDVALAALIKGQGGRLWLATTHRSRSLRRYDWRGFVEMVARTAFTELRHSWLRLVGALVGLGLVFVAPVLLLVIGEGVARLLALAAVGLMLWSYRPMVAAYGLPWPWVLGLPAAAVAYMGMTLLSAWRHAQGQGPAWHGRRYAA